MLGLRYKANRTVKQLKQVRCKRCEQYHENNVFDCPHCSQLDETQLQTLKDQVAVQDELNSRLGRKLLLALAVVILLTIFVFIF